MTDRLERALVAAARRYAPQVLPASNAAIDLAALAHSLARNHVLIIGGEVSPDLAGASGVYFNDWLRLYTNLYTRICQSLFPSYLTVTAYEADDQFPPIMLLHGECIPPICTLADYVAPYIAAKQAAGVQVMDVELIGLMDQVLDELEAGDLPRADVRRLQGDCAGMIRALLNSEVRQRMITPPAPALGIAMPTVAAAPAPPDLPEVPPPPPDLPEDAPLGANDVPVFFNSAMRGIRRPPVPDLPE